MQLPERKILEHKDAGLNALKDNDVREARYHLLTAAELLFKLANASHGNLQEVRKAKAQKLLDLARDLNEPQAGEDAAKRSRADASDGSDGSDGGRRQVTDDQGSQAEDSDWLVAEKPTVTFEDIAGLHQVKREIRVRMLYPYTHPEEAARYGVDKGGGVLLYGPPGTGKTLLAQAVAAEIDAAFFNIVPSKVLSKWAGEAEKNVQRLFEEAAAHERSVIFIDEIDSLMPKRSSSDSTVMQRVVPQFLAELEGFEERDYDLLFIGATNVPWNLDPAVLRPGRFDVNVYVGLPDHEARAEVFRLNLEGRYIGDAIDYEALAELADGYSGADIKEVCHWASRACFLEVVEGQQESRPIEMADLRQALENVQPSVDQKSLSRMDKFPERSV